MDVIEAGWSQLQARIATANDFVTAAAEHQHFLDSLVSQCFLDMRNFNKILTVVFAICKRCCAVVQVGAAAADSAIPECACRVPLGVVVYTPYLMMTN